MTTDTNTTRSSHVRGTAAAIVAAALRERGLNPSADLPHNYRVGREILGSGPAAVSAYGVAYPPKFAAAHMPYTTTTRQLRRGFVILTEAEAAAIALDYVSGRGRELAAERLADTIARCDGWAADRPAEADRYAEHKAHAQAHYQDTIAKLDKAQARYAKLVAKTQPTTTTEEVAVPATVQGTTVPAAQPLADGELAELIRTKLASEERHTAELERLARIAAQTQAALIVEIQAAGQAGLTNRAISRASGLSHPTVAKILADPAKYGGQTAS
jgi:hypothetical protein